MFSRWKKRGVTQFISVYIWMCFSLIFFPFQYLLGNKCSQESVSDIVSIFSSYWLSFSSQQPLSESKLTSARAESDSEWTAVVAFASDEQPTFSKLVCVCVCLHCFRCSSCVSYRFASIFDWFVHRHTMPLHVSFRWKYVSRPCFRLQIPHLRNGIFVLFKMNDSKNWSSDIFNSSFACCTWRKFKKCPLFARNESRSKAPPNSNGRAMHMGFLAKTHVSIVEDDFEILGRFFFSGIKEHSPPA